MASKNRQTSDKQQSTGETWRKPLQVPPRENAMRSFYQKDSETITSDNAPELPKTEIVPAENSKPEKAQQPKALKPASRELEIKNTQTKPETPAKGEKQIASQSNSIQENKLTEEKLTELLGFELEELFDVHELLRGKSFDIYLALTESCDEKGRCKITQPELMKRTGIKNRRTFYKHEEWLIKLGLLEKRHLPGDHKGVVYRVARLAEMLPMRSEMIQQFEASLMKAK